MFNYLLENLFMGNGMIVVVFASLIAFGLMLVAGRWFMAFAQVHLRAVAREDTPEAHRAKDFTPTMGGACIVAVMLAVMLLGGFWTPHIVVLAGIALSFCIIGAWDDWKKISERRGISERKKFTAQVVCATALMTLWYLWAQPSTMIVIPYWLSLSFDVGPVLFIAWAVWVIACTVNAVNFTDGLDGLATLLLLATFTTFGVLALWLGYYDVLIFIAAIVGALLGFLWFNAYPAQMFMGDAGSLALGALLATVALMTKTELFIPLAGGMFVLEGVSVALQILYFKVTGERLLKMAPIHHHFEILGCPETKITLRFFIVTLLLCGATLAVFLAS
jgi:phospho-N-acetylmuramoyl-pentapeptide-transferase